EAMELGHRVAVLDSGVMSALGPPESIYDAPPNEYVARFLGTANIWPGAFGTASPGALSVEIAAGILPIAPQRAGSQVPSTGDRVSIVARPEHLTIRPGSLPPGLANALGGTLSARLFSGAHTEFVVRLADGTDTIVWMQDVSGLGELVVGDAVH